MSLILTVLTFIISTYTCFFKCRRMQKEINKTSKDIQEYSESVEVSQKCVKDFLRSIDLKITQLEQKIEKPEPKTRRKPKEK